MWGMVWVGCVEDEVSAWVSPCVSCTNASIAATSGEGGSGRPHATPSAMSQVMRRP